MVSFIAYFASVGSLPCVNSCVFFKVVRLVEGSLTNVALVWFFSGVRSSVNRVRSHVLEFPFTNVALKVGLLGCFGTCNWRCTCHWCGTCHWFGTCHGFGTGLWHSS
uniref:Uncharacterized protein n=1 Tax=Ciona savignyi TaxID=51511 RepID=H2YYK4_CIOSA